MKKQCITLVAVLFGLTLFFSCNSNDDTGENLTPGDLLTTVDNAHDIYFIDSNTLYGVRDRQDPSSEGVGQMEAFLEIAIPSVAPTVSSPVVISTSASSGTEAEGYTDKKLVVVSGDGIMYCYDIPSGNLLWELNLNGQVRGTPSFRTFRDQNTLNTYLYVGTTEGIFYCIDVLNESLVWAHEHPGRGGFVSSTTDNRTGITSVGTSDGTIYTFNAEGGLLWEADNLGLLMLSKPALNMVPVNGGLGYELSSVIGSTMDGTLFSLDGATGNQIWSQNLDGSPLIAAPYLFPIIGGTLTTDSFYVNTFLGKVYNVSMQDGSILETVGLDAPISSSPSRLPGDQLRSQNDFIYASSEKTLYALDRIQGGQEVWSLPLDPPVYATPNIVPSANNGTGLRCYINTISGLYGINAVTGTIFSEYELPGFTPTQTENLNYQISPVVIYVEPDTGITEVYHPNNIL